MATLLCQWGAGPAPGHQCRTTVTVSRAVTQFSEVRDLLPGHCDPRSAHLSRMAYACHHRATPSPPLLPQMSHQAVRARYSGALQPPRLSRSKAIARGHRVPPSPPRRPWDLAEPPGGTRSLSWRTPAAPAEPPGAARSSSSSRRAHPVAVSPVSAAPPGGARKRSSRTPEAAAPAPAEPPGGARLPLASSPTRRRRCPAAPAAARLCRMIQNSESLTRARRIT